MVVLHDIAGLGSDVRAQAHWLAEQGFLAVAPDRFDGRTPLRCLRTTMRDYTARRGRTFDLIETTPRPHPCSAGTDNSVITDLTVITDHQPTRGTPAHAMWHPRLGHAEESC